MTVVWDRERKRSHTLESFGPYLLVRRDAESNTKHELDIEKGNGKMINATLGNLSRSGIEILKDRKPNISCCISDE